MQGFHQKQCNLNNYSINRNTLVEVKSLSLHSE